MVVVVIVVMAGVVVGGSLGVGELLSGRGLSLGVQVLNLGLTEDAATLSVAGPSIEHGFSIHVGVARGRLVDIGLVDDEENLEQKCQKTMIAIHRDGCAPR